MQYFHGFNFHKYKIFLIYFINLKKGNLHNKENHITDYGWIMDYTIHECQGNATKQSIKNNALCINKATLLKSVKVNVLCINFY